MEMIDALEELEDMELGELDLQGIKESCKQKISIPETQLELFKEAVIKARTTLSNSSKYPDK